VLFLSILPIVAQEDMQPGFVLLEKGDFQEAKLFFGNYLQQSPTNKTAQICYGRAVGLSGEPKKAMQLFSDLLKSYPTDVEVQLNFNESFLWDKQYAIAKPLYAKLVAVYPENFGAVLGYANTLSNLKEYKAALKWINKALELQPGNTSAEISKKYIKLGYANSQLKDQKYGLAEKTLNEIFEIFPNDKITLLNMANLFLITKDVQKAKFILWKYANSPKDSITAMNKARKQIDSLELQYPNRKWIYALKATLGLYTGDTKGSILNYNAILKDDETSFDGNLGMANALFAADRIVPAYKAAFRTLRKYY